MLPTYKTQICVSEQVVVHVRDARLFVSWSVRQQMQTSTAITGINGRQARQVNDSTQEREGGALSRQEMYGWTTAPITESKLGNKWLYSYQGEDRVHSILIISQLSLRTSEANHFSTKRSNVLYKSGANACWFQWMARVFHSNKWTHLNVHSYQWNCFITHQWK